MVAIATRQHLFPFRTQQLSLSAPMVLHGRLCGRVGRRHNRGFFFAQLFCNFPYRSIQYTASGQITANLGKKNPLLN